MPYIYDIIDGGDIEELKNFLEGGANPDDVSNEDNDDMEGCTPLFFANSEQSKILIDAGANVHQVDSRNENALFYLNVIAAEDPEDKLKKVNLLLEHGLDINHKNSNGENMLFCMGYEYSMEDLNFFESKGLDIFCINNDNENLLFKVSDNQPLAIKKYLVHKGLNIHQENAYGENLFFKTENVDTLRYYLNNGVNLSKRNKDGNTILMLTNSHRVMDFAIKNEIDVHAISDDGFNALDNCLFFDDIVKTLLDENIAILHEPENYEGFRSAPMIERKRLEYSKEKALKQKNDIEKSLGCEFNNTNSLNSKKRI